MAHYDQNYKVYKVVVGVDILDHVHHICPALQRYDKENGNPGKANVVKGDNSMERIVRSNTAVGVEHIPIDTSSKLPNLLGSQVTDLRAILECRQV